MMRTFIAALAALLVGCASAGRRTIAAPAPATPSAATAESTSTTRPQYPSTYVRHPNPPVVIRNATIMTATGQEIPNGSILLKDGRIVAVGTKVDAPADAVVVDGTGKYVTPGLIDDHSHRGVDAEVRVVVDQPGRHVLAGPVHDHGVGGGVDLRADRDDPPILEQDRAVGDLLTRRGHDRGVADHDRRVRMANVGGWILWTRGTGALL